MELVAFRYHACFPAFVQQGHAENCNWTTAVKFAIQGLRDEIIYKIKKNIAPVCQRV